MEELTSMAELKRLQRKKKLEEMKRAATEKLQQGARLVSENKEILTVAIPAMAVGIKQVNSLTRTMLHGHNLKRDEREKQMRWYDPSLGHYWYTKRPLKPEEQLTVKRRRKAGENLGDILESMRVLK